MQANTTEPNELQTLRAAVQEWAQATAGHESAVLAFCLNSSDKQARCNFADAADRVFKAETALRALALPQEEQAEATEAQADPATDARADAALLDYCRDEVARLNLDALGRSYCAECESHVCTCRERETHGNCWD
jgi:hypothetical protein